MHPNFVGIVNARTPTFNLHSEKFRATTKESSSKIKVDL